MEILRNMLSAGRIIRLLIVVLACVAVWKVWDYVGWGHDKNSSQPQPNVPLPIKDANIKDADVLRTNFSKPPDLNELEVSVSSRVRVQVFYEPLCPDSRYFFKHQLTPAMEKLADHIDLQLVPYGKATTNDENGKLTFQCQHGPTECLANKIHGCVVREVPDQRQLAKIVDCMIADNYKPKQAGQKCVVQVLGTGTWAPIQKCYTGRRGDQILKHMGSITHSLDPAVTFIPTITVQGSQEDQRHILQDLTKVVCKHITGETPVACAGAAAAA